MTAPVLGVYKSPRGTLSGGDTQVRDLLVDIVLEHERSRPRSIQTDLGPSEIGDPCARSLAYKISGFPEPLSFVDDPWFAIMGTAIHAWLADALERKNRQAVEAGQTPPWLIEQRVQIHHKLSGSCDAANVPLALCVDHKVQGKTAQQALRKHGPKKAYHVQIHTYGYGMRLAGIDICKVAIASFPRFDYITKGMYVWSEPYNETVVVNALARVGIIEELVRQINPAADPIRFTQIPKTPSADCRLCPWNKPGLDTGATCPGNL